MTFNKTRIILAATFIAGLAVQLTVVGLSYAWETIDYKDLMALVTKLLGLYAVHLAVIVGGIFASQTRNRRKVPDASFWMAVVLAVMWNVLLAWRTLLFGWAAYDVLRDDRASRLLSYIDSVGTASSFLVAGALTYFFTRTLEPGK